MNKFTETPNIALDIETLSTQPTAAIISIAARVFTFSETTTTDNAAPRFTCLVDAASYAMEGLHFSMDTVRWWQQQNEDAKQPFTDYSGRTVTLRKALDSLNTFFRQMRSQSPTGHILVWCQGTDFDIPILKNAYHVCLGWETPWHHEELRDARTFIHTTLCLIRPDVHDPYSLIPKNPNWHPHEALSDVDQLIWNVRHVTSIFRATLSSTAP